MRLVRAKSLPLVPTTALFIALALLSGCAHKRPLAAATQPDLLPPGMAQPRLREVLAYMARRGIENADKADVFEFAFWPMYEELTWDDNFRKPRFEGAMIKYADTRITVAVSPVKAYHTGGEVPEKVILTYAKKGKEPNGASVILEGHAWTVGFTMAKPDAKVREQLTQIIRDFVNGYAALEPRYERE
jgi:hypothetical protein